MPNNQGPMSYMYDSAAMHKPVSFASSTAPATPSKPALPKPMMTPSAPTVTSTMPGIGKMSNEVTGKSLCKIAHEYALQKGL